MFPQNYNYIDKTPRKSCANYEHKKLHFILAGEQISVHLKMQEHKLQTCLSAIFGNNPKQTKVNGLKIFWKQEK